MIGLIVELTLLVCVLAWWIICLKRQDRTILELNKEVQRQNEDAQKELEQKQSKLKDLRIVIEAQENILKSVTNSAETMRESAEQRAEESFQARLSALEQDYETRKSELEANYSALGSKYASRIAEQQNIIDDLESKQLAYIQAQQREEEKQSNVDYYRLVISDMDKSEITMLRNIQLQFLHKDAIDKLIWEVYYKPAYDNLMAHLFDNKTKVCGIYKITDISNGQAYIGQSVDMRERFRQHTKASLSSAPATNKLYQQMKSSGPDNFTFEVLEEVTRDKLNDRETYWINFYKTKEYGLNKTAGNNP